ncbi:hypothetical protein Agabi119p4_7448 [Agaricus bisporus var. burnettii]|uniref:Uncharacterized protein n=1 Tax=Agaricus bisporus var. burnettii TaxID=192524 RepID=A0A8H7C885_AGABI|nr:hypothetical protein Agabi119p4_7448 [Agaricus bisporus var. burnettii]
MSQRVAPRDHTWKTSTGSDLYLATFLTTLCLLLFGSCAILIRSIVLRRRLRRRLQGPFFADGMGTVHPPRRRKRRPKFHTHWISPVVGSHWQDIMPLSLRFVLGKRSPKTEQPKTEVKMETKRFGLWSRSTSTPPEDPTTTPTKLEIAQISVLIEMPSLHHSALYGAPKPSYLDDELPELVIGYARCYKHDFATHHQTEEEKDCHPRI